MTCKHSDGDRSCTTRFPASKEGLDHAKLFVQVLRETE